MTCETTRRALSERSDGEVGDDHEIAAHVLHCPSCQAFEDELVGLRQLLRFEPVDHVPDVVPAVLATIRAEAGAEADAEAGARAGTDAEPGTDAEAEAEAEAGPRSTRPGVRPSWLAVAAAVAVGALAGALFVGIGRQPNAPAAAEIPERILTAQHGTTSLQADLEVVDHAGPVGGSTRRFTGRLTYEAPESLAVTLADRDGARIDVIFDEDTWWAEGPRRCGPPSQPGVEKGDGPLVVTCTSIPTRRRVTNREPFADAAPVPLDVVAPVDSFARSDTPITLGTREIGGRDAIGVEVTASQVAPVLAGFDPTGALRDVHPADLVELWLDADHLVPLALTIRAAATDARQRWEAARGYDDEPGAVLLAVTLTNVRINDRVPDAVFRPPAEGAMTMATDGGFRDHENPDAPIPATLPTGLAPHRAGVVRPANGPEIAVRSWTDGRAWLVVRATRDWTGRRLFGGLGESVRRVDLPGAGVAYVSDDDTRVALHAPDVDIVVTGSLPRRDLLAVAGSLGVRGQSVPDDWSDAATATVDEAVAAGAELVPGDLDGFAAPGVRIDGDTITVSAAGAGERAFSLVSTPGHTLPPPLAPDVVGVRLRWTTGRYSPERGDLEWVEDGRVYSLRSSTLGLAELVAIAEGLERR
ncbi:MAG: hypothetical protein ACRD29_24150 [Acidimicrobiales bacterium]